MNAMQRAKPALQGVLWWIARDLHMILGSLGTAYDIGLIADVCVSREQTGVRRLEAAQDRGGSRDYALPWNANCQSEPTREPTTVKRAVMKATSTSRPSTRQGWGKRRRECERRVHTACRRWHER